MGRYKFNNRGTGTTFGFFLSSGGSGGGQGWSPPPPPWTCSDTENLLQSVRGRNRSPPHPPWNVDEVTQAMSEGGGGGGVLVNVQEWGCFSIFRRADDACGMSSPPSSGNPVSAPVICVKSGKSTPLPPPNQSVPYGQTPPPPHTHTHAHMQRHSDANTYTHVHARMYSRER